MNYLICAKCGKHYPLNEGKSSFNFEKCECGGKLKYSPSPNDKFVFEQNKEENQSMGSFKNSSIVNLQNLKTRNQMGKLNWKGILAGLLFFFISLIIAILAIFGTKLPDNPLNISSQILTFFSILMIFLIFISGFISAYISGSRRYIIGALNGGLIGIILGVIVGMAGGIVAFIAGVLIFGLFSMIGGIIGIIPRKYINKFKK